MFLQVSRISPTSPKVSAVFCVFIMMAIRMAYTINVHRVKDDKFGAVLETVAKIDDARDPLKQIFLVAIP